MGYAIATAGDVNGDGYDDLVVGAPRAQDLVYREGVASLFYGGPGGLATTPAWRVGGGQQGSRFGAAVAAAGDLNGDGYGDLVVGAADYNNGTTSTGAAMVFYGSRDGLSAAPDWSFVSTYRDANVGYAVAGGGDLNGDDYDDLLVGARWFTDNLANEGGVLIFYGSGGGLRAAPDLLLAGGQAGAGLGHAVAGGGDVNGDGYHDVLVGAPLYDQIGADEGAAFLHLGSPEGLASAPAWTAYGEQDGAWFGASVTLCGDVNGDDYDDLVVGAPGDIRRVDRGALYVYYGSATGPGQLPDVVIVSGQLLSGLGSSLARAGDLNDDGYDDLLAGAYSQEDDQKDEGGTFVYFGSPLGLHPIAGWAGWGDKAEVSYGFAVGPAGMANASGFPAIAIGAPDYKRDEKTKAGRAFVYYGPLEPRARSHIWLPLIVQEAIP
jgi:hypothetical protein